MIRPEIHDHFIDFMERERTARGYTQSEMAALLDIPTATYKNIVYRRSDTIDINIACRLYDLTHRWMFDMCGYATSDSVFLDAFASLSPHDKKAVQSLTMALAELENKEHEKEK